MHRPFLVFIKNKNSSDFQYKQDVINVEKTDLRYIITFSNQRSYPYNIDNVQYYPYIGSQINICIYEKGQRNQQFNIVDNFGEYLIFRNESSSSYPIKNDHNIEICESNNNSELNKTVIDYFKNILTQRCNVSFEIPKDKKEDDKQEQSFTEMQYSDLKNIDLTESKSALTNYLNGVNPKLQQPDKQLIYPFGCNESQISAVEQSFSNSITIIEGPPGTGKTQTILNIIANLIIQNKSVAIVSNNNSAVSNIREKLEKDNYDILIASLGNQDNIMHFFNNLKEQNVEEKFKLSVEDEIKANSVIQDLEVKLKLSFQLKNKLATLKTQLSDIELEFRHIQTDQPLNHDTKSVLDTKLYRTINYNKILKFKQFISNILIKKKISIINKIQLIFQYGLLDIAIVNTYRNELNTYVNHRFYELYINKIREEISSTEKLLELNDEESNLKHFIRTSKTIFDNSLYKKYKEGKNKTFNVFNYKSNFNDFINYYPIILSSTLSLKKCIPNNYLFDYLIIDESSQVDIIKSSICFSCCRNVVIVGDSMQLTHIVDKESIRISEELKTLYNIAPAYDYVKNNILDSLKCLSKNTIKSVLLREHYRCHPTIIGFCNKKFYNNELIIMTEGTNHPFRIIETNVSGTRYNHNQRQIDETILYIKDKYADNYANIGVVAPYKNHVKLLNEQLPKEVEADTIHKFQGREKDIIIFNTVKDKICDFIDNPNLINVSVSRAVKEFIVVKPASMKLTHGKNISDMIRYMCYTTDPEETIIKGKVCSVFDILYKEYNKLFTIFIESNHNIKGSPAEIIIYKLLTEKILKEKRFLFIDIVREYKLKDLISAYKLFSEDEISFIENNSRLDFLLYNRLDKTPILAIEVDGASFHDNDIQQERDNKKNHILETINLPLLRLSTDGSDEENKILKKLEEIIDDK